MLANVQSCSGVLIAFKETKRMQFTIRQIELIQPGKNDPPPAPQHHHHPQFGLEMRDRVVPAIRLVSHSDKDNCAASYVAALCP